MSTPSKTEAQKRADRLAKALRANLGRRKSQARGRDATAPEAADTPQSDAEKPQGEQE
jgi:hypothetical protein